MSTGDGLTGRRKAAARGEPTLRLPPVGFWSYARQDDELSGGRLSRLRLLLAQELQQQYGREPIKLFQDMNAIAHGAAWEKEIRRAIGESTFFVPIITPNFLQSEWCSREVALFLERERELRAAYPQQAEASRIFPILFIGIEDSEPEDPDVLEALQKLQWFDFRRYRHRSFDETEVLEALANLASTMRSLLKTKIDADSSTGKRDRQAGQQNPTAVTVAAGMEAPSPPLAPRGRAAGQIEVGDRLNNIFEVKRFIKAGGMGQVFEGANIRTGERVAIKTLLPAMAADPRTAAMFQREAMTLTRLSHEALVQYRVLAEEPALGVLYIVTEYVDGVDLAETLGQAGRSPEELERLLGRLASGLAAAHRLGAIHRDMSPDNVMLPGGDIHQAKIIDFGIAKDLVGNLPTLVGDSFAGKLSFVAPEQLGEYGGEIGPWTDVYSLALVVLTVAKGQKLDMGGSFADALRKRREEVDVSVAPATLRSLLADMLRADPSDRLRSMDEVLVRLAAGEERTASSRQDRAAAVGAAQPVGAVGDGVQFAWRTRAAGGRGLWLGFILGLVAITVAVVVLVRSGDEVDVASPAPAPQSTTQESARGAADREVRPEPAEPRIDAGEAGAPTKQAGRPDEPPQRNRVPLQQAQQQQSQSQFRQPQPAQPQPNADHCTQYPDSPVCLPAEPGRTFCETYGNDPSSAYYRACHPGD